MRVHLHVGQAGGKELVTAGGRPKKVQPVWVSWLVQRANGVLTE